MEIMSSSEIKKIALIREPNCVTIYLPTHVATNDQQEDMLRLRTLIDEVRRQLIEGQAGEREIRVLTGGLYDLIGNRDFWQSRGKGLAIFATMEGLQCYRLPFEVEEFMVVADRFCIKPILRLFNEPMKLFVLVLSQRQVRLFEKREYELEEVDIELPQRLEETLNLHSVESGPQSHFAKPGGKGKATSVFHGHGGKKDTHKDELRLFFRAIDQKLLQFLNEDHSPLILAGVDYLLPLYREVSHHKNIGNLELIGNWDHNSRSELHDRIQTLVAPMFDEQRRRAVDKYFDLKGSGKSTEELVTALSAAIEGRVEVLFVDVDQHVWGRYTEEGRRVEIHSERQVSDCDLIDVTAVETLQHGGKVYAVKESGMPSHCQLAAVMRY